MSSINHLHTYRRSKDNFDVYRCKDPRCTHFDTRDAIVGKEILCSTCHEPCLALQIQLKAGQNRPGRRELTCLAHSASPRSKEALAVQDVLENLLKDQAS